MKSARITKEKPKQKSSGYNYNRVLLHRIEGLQIFLEKKQKRKMYGKQALESEVELSGVNFFISLLLGGVLKKIGWPWDLHFLASLWQNKVGIVQHFCGAVILVKERSLAGHREGGRGGGGGWGWGVGVGIKWWRSCLHQVYQRMAYFGPLQHYRAFRSDSSLTAKEEEKEMSNDGDLIISN